MLSAETNQVRAQSTRQVGGCRQDNDEGSKAVWDPVCKVGLVWSLGDEGRQVVDNQQLAHS